MNGSIPLAAILTALAVGGAVLGLLVHRAGDALTARLRYAGAPRPPALRVRTLVVAGLVACALPSLYWWEVVQRGLTPELIPALVPPGALTTGNLAAMLQYQFAAHVVWLALMLIASLIDLDERVIPDVVTVPGTILGLVLCTAYPWVLLAGDSWIAAAGGVQLEFVTLSSPNRWPAALEPGRLPALAAALGAWWVWCLGLLDRRWIGRRGVRRALVYLLVRLRRSAWTWIVLPLALAGSGAIGWVWLWGSTAAWAGLLTSLTGMLVAGGIVWAVRIAGAWALGREAMGFGDVTLMSMIGALIGWQAGLIAFFVAPLAALAIGLANWLLHGERELPFGPYLCLGAAAVVVRWPAFWDWGYELFAAGWLAPVAIGVCLVLLALLLRGWRAIRELLGGPR